MEALKWIEKCFSLCEFKLIILKNNGLSMIVNAVRKTTNKSIINHGIFKVCRWFSKTEQIHDLFPLLVDIIHEGNFLKNVKTALKGIRRILRNCSNICWRSIRIFFINNNGVKKILPSFQYSTKIIT